MRTHTITVYKFEELSKEAQERAIGHFNTFDYEWWECEYDDAATVGLRITSFDLDRNLHAEGELTKDGKTVCKLILKNHGKACDTYKLACAALKARAQIVRKTENQDADSENGLSYEGECALEQWEADFEKDLLEEYAHMLQKQADYMQSRENIVETINANEYEFTAEGKLV